jgi:hypothetical protein
MTTTAVKAQGWNIYLKVKPCSKNQCYSVNDSGDYFESETCKIINIKDKKWVGIKKVDE